MAAIAWDSALTGSLNAWPWDAAVTMITSWGFEASDALIDCSEMV